MSDKVIYFNINFCGKIKNFEQILNEYDNIIIFKI